MKPDKEKQPKTTTPKKPNGKVFDVSRPGKAAATPTSKPVILGHKPEAQQAQTSVSGVGEARPLLSRRKIEITPLGDLKKPEAEPTEEVKTPDTEAAPSQPTQEETDALATTALDAAVTGPPGLEGAKEPESISASPKLNIEPPTQAKPEEPAEEPKPEPAPEAEPEPEPTAEAEQVTKSEPQLAEKELPAETSSMPEPEAVKESTEKDSRLFKKFLWMSKLLEIINCIEHCIMV